MSHVQWNINICSSSTTSAMLSHNSKSIQIGVRCSRTKKCSLRYQIDHFCRGFFQPFNLRKFFRNPVGPGRGTFSFTHPTSDILVRPHWSLRSYRDWRSVQKYVEPPQELHLEIPFERYAEIHFEMLFETSPDLHLEMHVCNSIMHANPHPQPSYQASAWS